MKHVSVRMQNYLYKRVEDFAEAKAVNVSEAIRFILENYTQELEETQNVKRLIKGLETKIDNLVGFSNDINQGENFTDAIEQLGARMENELNVIRTILLILGTVEPLAKGKLKQLFPHYFKQ